MKVRFSTTPLARIPVDAELSSSSSQSALMAVFEGLTTLHNPAMDQPHAAACESSSSFFRFARPSPFLRLLPSSSLLSHVSGQQEGSHLSCTSSFLLACSS